MLNSANISQKNKNICICCSSPLEQNQNWFHCPNCGYKVRKIISKRDYSAMAHRNKDLNNLKEKTQSRFKYLNDFFSSKWNAKCILELGCAEGFFLHHLKKNQVHIITTGIEPSLDQNLAQENVDRLYKNISEIDLDETNKFDLICSFHVLEHIEDLESIFLTLKKLSAPNCFLYLEVPNQSGSEYIEEDPNLEHIHSFSIISLNYLLEKYGYEVLQNSSGHYESASYQNSIRVIAKLKSNEYNLKERIKEIVPSNYYIWGLGGDFHGYVKDFIDIESVSGFIDNSITSIQLFDKVFSTITPSSLINSQNLESLIIASGNNTNEILEYIKNNNIQFNKIISLKDLLQED
ncbi:MAG: class I SAM-dependent methyltransferase [Candidatus Caenarcaniphilales bacterium]|nr:class I SAM-dependent methyltransferase [Candidatus Caenarcaniphilales bacterium]